MKGLNFPSSKRKKTQRILPPKWRAGFVFTYAHQGVHAKILMERHFSRRPPFFPPNLSLGLFSPSSASDPFHCLWRQPTTCLQARFSQLLISCIHIHTQSETGTDNMSVMKRSLVMMLACVAAVATPSALAAEVERHREAEELPGGGWYLRGQEENDLVKDVSCVGFMAGGFLLQGKVNPCSPHITSSRPLSLLPGTW
jgi:hypothetical protein